MQALELTDQRDCRVIVNLDNVVMVQEDHDELTKGGSKIFFTEVAGREADFLLVKESVDDVTEALENVTVVMQKV